MAVGERVCEVDRDQIFSGVDSRGRYLAPVVQTNSELTIATWQLDGLGVHLAISRIILVDNTVGRRIADKVQFSIVFLISKYLRKDFLIAGVLPLLSLPLGMLEK